LDTFSRIRYGMVGGGEGAFIGQIHRLAANLDGQYDLVCSAFSRDPDNNKRSSAALGIVRERAYVSWQDLIQQESLLPENERMQVVVIVTPNHLHVPIAKEALESGFHVLSEKPAGTSIEEVQLLSDVLHKTDKLYGLAHTYLGYPMIWQARAMVEGGLLGQIRKVYVEYPQGWLSANEEAHNKQAAWRTDPALAGASGCMGDIGTHAFGLAEFVLSQKITSLCGHLETHIDGRRVDDDGAALLRTEHGASGVLIASQVCTGEENPLSIRVYGDKGGLHWRQMEPNSLTFRPEGESYRVLRAGQGQAELCHEALRRCRTPAGHPEGFLEAMANLYRDFAQAIRQGERITATGVPGIASGLRGMQFIDAILSSANNQSRWTTIR